MRQTAASSGISVKAYAGTSGIILAWAEWLAGMLDFEGAGPSAGRSSTAPPFPTNVWPMQRVRSVGSWNRRHTILFS